MSGWSLDKLLAGLHDEIEQRLAIARITLGHAVAKGDASESVWLELFQKYLPERYVSARAFVVDSKGDFSDQIDIVIFDRQYSPLIFKHQDQVVIPAESVYAVLESKQSINSEQVSYAVGKIASVRRLHRTSLPIPHAGGVYEPRQLQPILGGLLTFESDWSPPLGTPLMELLTAPANVDRLDIGCVAAHGAFWKNGDEYAVQSGGKAATGFLLELIARLQDLATVPMIDIRRYAEWLPE